MIYFYDEFINLEIPVERALIGVISSENYIEKIENLNSQLIEDIDNLPYQFINAYLNRI